MPPDPPSACALREHNANATPTLAINLIPDVTTQNFVATALFMVVAHPKLAMNIINGPPCTFQNWNGVFRKLVRVTQ